MWDFVGRTRGLLAMLDPQLPDSQKEEWNDVVGRAAYADALIWDETKGSESVLQVRKFAFLESLAP